MNREEAFQAVRSSVQNQNLIKHMLATEAVMRALAVKFGEDEQEWGLTGLLHDIDVDLSGGDMKVHGKMGAELVSRLGAGGGISRAILVRNEAHGILPESRMEKALFCADPLTGLITACALVRPDKRLSSVVPSSVTRRFGEKRFAAGANREQIGKCSELGLKTDEFIAVGLLAMQSVSDALGL